MKVEIEGGDIKSAIMVFYFTQWPSDWNTPLEMVNQLQFQQKGNQNIQALPSL